MFMKHLRAWSATWRCLLAERCGATASDPPFFRLSVLATFLFLPLCPPCAVLCRATPRRKCRFCAYRMQGYCLAHVEGSGAKATSKPRYQKWVCACARKVKRKGAAEALAAPAWQSMLGPSDMQCPVHISAMPMCHDTTGAVVGWKLTSAELEHTCSKSHNNGP